MAEKHSPTEQRPPIRHPPGRGSWQGRLRPLRRLWDQPALPFRLSSIVQIAAAGLLDQFTREQEQRRTFLWFPVLYAAGIIIYYQLPQEPVLTALGLISGVLLTISVFCFVRNKPCQVWVAVSLIAFGALTAKIRTDSVSTFQLDEQIFVSLHGTVASVDIRADRPPRVVLSNPVLESRRKISAPGRVRVALLKTAGVPPIGETITLRARVGPVPGPVVPGGYDPRRAAFFEGIGASGFAVGHWSQSAEGHAASRPRILMTGIEQVRQAMARRILQNQPGPAGAVAVALLVGERGYLPPEIVQHLRDAGLAHILAISGLHMALFAGSVFFVVRGLLALSVTLALNWPIRKWAACAALVAATFYLFLSGGNVATLRAFIMASIMFGAILVNRPAISLRNLAIAALIILASEPESIMEPGFQMSFAAVTALIAFYETWRERPKLDLAEPPATLVGRTARHMRRSIGAIALTTMIAGLATGPVAAYHFNHVAVYSLVGNLLAMPIVTLVIMPAGLFSLIMMPFGLEAGPLALMATGSNAIMHVAATVSGWQGATLIAAATAPLSLAVFMFGFLWLCLWRLKWRWLGLIPAAVAPMLVLSGGTEPDILIASSGKIVAVRDHSGMLRISAKRQNQYVLEQWFKREGEPLPGRNQLAEGVRCDPSACLLNLADGKILAHIRSHSAFDEECRSADIIVTPLNAPANCQAHLIIDRPQLDRFGAHTISVEKNEDKNPGAKSDYRIVTAYPAVRRLWHGKPATGQ